MRQLILLLPFLLPISNAVISQSVLDQYVKVAIQQNLSIAEKRALEIKEQAALKHAGKLFGPELKFLTTYTVAGGGRSIQLPVGFLLNDVYSTLNELTGSQQFNPIQDEEVTFLPNNFYDARFRITQPILQPELRINRDLKVEQLHLAELETDRTKRDLVRDVKSSYFRWMQARESVSILDQGLAMLSENKRITEGLARNGMATPSAVMRIEAEISRLQAQREKASTDVANAAAYFNFLLHRPADAEIMKEDITGLPDMPSVVAVSGREEIQQLETGLRMQQLARQLEKKKVSPTLGVQFEAGSQAFAPDWGGYYLGGLQLEIPIWDNQKSKLKQEEWQAQMNATQASQTWTQHAFEVQLRTEIESLRSDIALYESYASIRTADKRFYEETLRRYKEGVSNYIELLDARTQVTQTELLQNIAKYQAWLRHVQIERFAATAVLPE